jgi:hypothetical protein
MGERKWEVENERERDGCQRRLRAKQCVSVSRDRRFARPAPAVSGDERRTREAEEMSPCTMRW